MKKLIFTISFLSILNLFAISKEELKPGDVILLPLNCMLCKAIEDAEETDFSHSGLILWDQYKRPFVVEALGKVRAISLDSFVKRAPVGRPPYIYRARELANHPNFENLANELFNVYLRDFDGLGFDSAFLWDNFDSNNQELHYCSEFVAKLLNNFLNNKITPYPMDFSNNFDYWVTYFKGDVPQGKLGNSPASFTRDENFVNLGPILH